MVISSNPSMIGTVVSADIASPAAAHSRPSAP